MSKSTRNQDLFEWCLSHINSAGDNEQRVRVRVIDTSIESDTTEWKGQGYCCFCNDACNPAQQACGPCLRN